MARETVTGGVGRATSSTVNWESAAADGNKFPASWQVVALIRNGSANPITATIARPGTVDGETLADREITVGADTIVAIGQLDPALYAQSDGYVYINWSATTNVQIIVVTP